MIGALAVAALLAGASGIQRADTQQADTTFAVRAGGTLEIETHAGSVTVGVWDRDAIRVETARSDRSRPRVRVDGTRVRIDTESIRPGLATADYTITVPRNFGVQVDGLNVVVTVEGTTGDVEVDNVEGSITVRGVTGAIDVESVSGGVLVQDVRGRVDVTTINQNIRLVDVRGAIAAETVNGGITIRGADAARVHASTVNGFVDYDGAVRDGGNYYLGAHNGRITMSLAERTNASVRITTNSGRVDAAFPVQITTLRDRRTQFTLGNGSATVELESFNGTVHLVRPAGR